MLTTLFIIRRVLYAAILVLAVVVVNFLLIQFAPGDPIDTLAGQMGGMTEDIRKQLEAAYGLDQPVIIQLGTYIGRVIQGDFGYSHFFNLPVSTLILNRIPATLLLLVTSLVIAIVVGTALGVVASRRPNGLVAQVITVVSVMGYSAPVFWTGMLLIILFASVFPIFPVSGMRFAANDTGVVTTILDVAHHLVLPALSLAIIQLAQYSRLTRASMLDVLGADYVRTARAKGLSERSVFFKHALRNAILPAITMIGLHFGNLLAGAIVVETVFNWPGLGRLTFDSVVRRDYPTLLGILFFSSFLVIVANQVTDLCYRLADPRIRSE